MKSEWKECTLGDLVTFQRGYDLPKNKMEEGTYPVIGSNGIIGFHNEYTTNEPSITIGRSGNVGIPFIYYGKTWSHNTTLYIKDYKENDPIFIYYFLKTLELEKYAGGSAVPTLNRNHIHNLPVCVSKYIDTQKKIGEILKALDDKIELNNAINNNLEEQAKALFCKLFSSNTSCENMTLGNVTTNIRERIGDRHATVLSAVNIGKLQSSDDFFTKRVYSNDISKYIIVREENFAYNPARINIGSIGINDLGVVGCVSPIYVVFTVEDGYQSFFEFYFKTKAFRAETMLRASGSVRQSLNYSDFALITIPYPEKKVAKYFNDFWLKQKRAIVQLKNENEKLSELRDTLLPKLMSGELDVSNIDI